MGLTTNTTKQRLKAGKMALGFGVHHLRTVAAPVLAAATGHDWMFIDGEHGAFTIQETTQLCSDRRVLAAEVSLRAFRDRGGNLLHALGAGGSRHQLHDSISAVNDGE